MIKKKTSRKTTQQRQKKAISTSQPDTNASVRAFFGPTGAVPDEIVEIIINEDNLSEVETGASSLQSQVDGTLEVMMIVSHPEDPEKPLLEVIMPEVVAPVIELMLTESLIPGLPSVMLTYVDDFGLFPNNFVKVECHTDNGTVLVMVDPEIKLALEAQGVDIERDVSIVMKEGGVSIVREKFDE